MAYRLLLWVDPRSAVCVRRFGRSDGSNMISVSTEDQVSDKLHVSFVQ